ncbi:MAG: hypothetical protein DRP08_01400 [Candidatus Aenigmatarchaeota archaeon]|nr:MAG: hypothetical protein DRP08_01400 [Candidatus Aenigmarchaeota archaeon]
MKRTQLSIMSLLVALLFMLATPVYAGTEAGNATVGVTLQSRTWVDLSKNSLAWTENVEPGTVPNCLSTDDDCISVSGKTNTVYALEIENIGSENVSKIWVNATMPTTNPFASGKTDDYNPGNFIAITNSEDGTGTYYFINRVEFAMPRAPVYLKRGSIPNNETGRFRNASKEWFWGLNKTSGCNATGTELYIGDSYHNPDTQGDIDLTDNTPYTLTTSTVDNSYGWANVTIGGEDYNVAVPSDCSRVIFYKWNMDLAGATESGTHATYIFDNTTEGHDFAPGNYTPIYIESRIPYGTYVGTLPTGYVRIIVN